MPDDEKKMPAPATRPKAVDELSDVELATMAPPPGFDTTAWAGMGIGNRRAYLWAIENTQKLTGGK